MSIEEISLVFDYGTKEGRERALEELHQHSDAKARPEREDEEMGGGKEQPAHVELTDEVSKRQ